LKLKAKTARKIASLSAIGAGVLVTGSTEAQAGVIVFDVNPNVNVGFTPGTTSNFSTSRASFANVGFNLLAVGGCGCSVYSGQQGIGGFGVNGLQFGVNTFSLHGIPGLIKLAIFDAGQTLGFADLSSPSYGFGVAARRWGYTSSGGPTGGGGGSCSINSTCTYGGGSSYRYPYTSHSVFGNAPFSHKYALFRFILNSEFHYGWVELSLDNPDVYGLGSGPTLTVHRWAISDTANAIVPAGADEELASGVPEPGSFALTGLGALALGAAGVRRWKAARKEAA
jgi:hypothetical protein